MTTEIRPTPRLAPRHRATLRTRIQQSIRIVFLIVSTLVIFSAKLSFADQAVHPTGIFPGDVLVVQAAVDAGGVVILKATDTFGNPKAFNFGPTAPGSGAVLLTRDVTILGETVVNQMTTIQGGHFPFQANAPIHSKIHGIHFNEPLQGAVLLNASLGTEISGNRISDVVGILSDGVTFGHGIIVSGFPNPANITGEVVIADNIINGVHAHVGWGIAISWQDAAAKIARNQVYGHNYEGILVARHTKLAQIVDNVVVPGPPQDPNVTLGNGIDCADSFGGSCLIARNTVICENPEADGILAVGNPANPVNNSVIEGNDITMHHSVFAGISFYGDVSHTFVRANKITGNGAFALQVARFPEGGTALSNTFAGNNIAQFEADIADVFLDVTSTKTMINGYSGTVIDLGVENLITGFTKRGIGQDLGMRIREALQRKHTSLQMMRSIVAR